MKKTLYLILSFCLSFWGCINDDILNINSERDFIELTYSVNSYIQNTSKTTSEGTNEEQVIDNLYIFLFPTSGEQSLIKYYISSTTFSGGSWSNDEGKISLNLTQTEVGNREVYLVANCSAIRLQLETVTSLSDLQSVLFTTITPWSPSLSTPILMSGNKSHNFISNYQLNSVLLIRAIAKIQLNMKLSEEHQALPFIADEAQYYYKYIDFDKNTYVLKPSTKTNNVESSVDWMVWNTIGTETSYVLDEGKVTNLVLTTYLNEWDNNGSAIEIRLPYNASGLLPPPEFGDEIFKLLLPSKVERNNWYVYDIEI